MLHVHAQRLRHARDPLVSLEQARLIFPDAASVSSPDASSGAQIVRASDTKALGYVVATSPRTDHLLGYSGPSNMLIGLDSDQRIAGIRLLWSHDTPEHIEMIERSPTFFKQWNAWKPETEAPPKIDAVSGATLTSASMAEAIQTRLQGTAASLRFPEEVTLAEAKKHFPAAVSVTVDGPRLAIKDGQGMQLGFILRTSPSADNVSGYAGPTECLVSLDPDGQTVRLVTVRKSYDNESYVEQVASDRGYLKLFAGRTLQTLAGMDFAKEQIEGVSGSTQTSYAVAESLKRRAEAVVKTPAENRNRFRLTWQDGLIAAFVLGGVLLSFSRLRGNARLRLAWQLMLVGCLGLYGGNLLSLSLFTGWWKHGFPWRSAPGLLLLAAAALVIPWVTRRQLYCHHVCPHGAAQSLLGKLFKRKLVVSPRLHAWFTKVPAFLLVLAIVLTLVIPQLDLTTWEPFDAWSIRATAWASGVIAILGLIASCFIPQAYCHYGCPTGALLRYLRSPGRTDRFSMADWIAGATLVIAAVMVVFGRP